MKILTLLTTLFISTTTLSKPINDECINAIPVDPMSNDIIVGDTTDATIDTVPFAAYCDEGKLGYGVWYTIKQDTVDLLLLTASLCNDGTNYDTLISVYKGDGCGNLECVGDNDQAGDRNCSIFTFLVSQAVTYYILVHGWSDSKGTFAMTFDSKIVQRAVNDECVNAIAVNPLAGPIVFGDTTGADVDFVSDDNNCDVPVYGPGVWYKFENNMDSLILVTASLCHNETEISPRISIFGGTCNTLSCIGAGYDYYDCTPINFLADKLSTYYILVHGLSDERGIFKMTVDGRITEKPSNDECVSAIVVDPNAGIILKGDLSGASEDVVPDECGDFRWWERKHGVWYRVDYVMNDLSLLTASTCNNGTLVDTKISVFKGNDCENLACIGGTYDVADVLCSSYNFLASEPTTFLIYVYGYNNDRDVFELKVDGRSVERPANNECVDAILVDPLANTIIIGDTSGASSISIIGDAYCDGAGEFPGVWYKTKNVMDISFLTSATLCANDNSFIPYLTVFEGNSCEELKRIQRVFGDEDEGCFTFEFLFTTSTMYYLFVDGFDQRGSFTLAFNSTSVSKAPNDECANAFLFNPLTEATLVGDTFGANADVPYPSDCEEYDGVWYKVEHQEDRLLNLTLFSCDDDDIMYFAYKGNDCNNLVMVGTGLDVEFGCQGLNMLLSNRDSYWILISKDFIRGTFAISVESSYPNVLAMIDSKTGSVVEALQGYSDYGGLPSSRLNIQASFNPDVNVKSVRMTFDRRSHCEKLSPYSVFGDMFGHFRDVIIPIGTHVVSATPYARPFCVGPAGLNLTKSFDVYGCSFGFEVYNDDFSTFIEYFEDIVLPPLPCQLNIQANVYCGFEVEMVRLELRNNSTNRLIAARNERVVPYTLYNGLGGPLAIGIYNLAVTIDGIKHPKIIFHINDACFGLAARNLK